MNKSEENYIDHEVRLRLVESAVVSISGRFDELNTKIDSHYRWINNLLLTLAGTIITVIVIPMFLHLKGLA
jgi:hypothetical protein